MDIAGSAASGNLVLSNFIGLDPSGEQDLGNSGYGVSMSDTFANQIGNGNVIAANQQGGVNLTGTTVPTGLVSLYQTQGNADDAIGGHNGTIHGNVTFVPGTRGQAFSFDGATGYIGTGTSVLATTNPFSISAWIDPTVTNSYEAIVSEIGTENAAGQYQFRIDPSGQLEFFRRTGGGPGVSDFITDATVTPGVWTYVTAVYSGGSNLAIYINGVQAAGTTIGSEYIAFAPVETRIGFGEGGGNGGDNFPFDGLMEGVALFNRALSPTEIQTFANAGSPVGNDVFGNIIGLDKTATRANDVNGHSLGNTGDGVLIDNSSFNLIGGMGGFATGNANSGNIISGNTVDGVDIIGVDSTGNMLAGNFIGTDATGTAALGNDDGVVIQSGAANNTIGGSTLAANVISGNSGDGVDISGSGTDSNLVAGNFIGTNATGTLPVGNLGSGVTISSGAQNNFVGFDDVSADLTGQGNVIADNITDGVHVSGDTTTGNTIRGNAIFANGGLGIDLGDPGNDNQSAPVLTSFTPGAPTIVDGTFQSNAAHQYVLDFYANVGPTTGGSNGNQLYLGSLNITTDGGGGYIINDNTLPSTLPSYSITVTATDITAGADFGDTSQFADPIADQDYLAHPDLPPSVLISGPSTDVAGTPASFTSQITPQQGDSDTGKTYTYAWSVIRAGNPAYTLPEGTATNLPSLLFVPATAGTYSISLTVIDSNGGTATATPLTLFVGVPGPGVVIENNPETGNVGDMVNLHGVVSEPTGAVTTNLAWSVQLNGQPYSLPFGTMTNTPDFTFPLDAAGVYAITLAVRDSAGAVGSVTEYLTVQGGSVVASIIAPTSAEVGVPITLQAAGNPAARPVLLRLEH